MSALGHSATSARRSQTSASSRIADLSRGNADFRLVPEPDPAATKHLRPSCWVNAMVERGTRAECTPFDRFSTMLQASKPSTTSAHAPRSVPSRLLTGVVLGVHVSDVEWTNPADLNDTVLLAPSIMCGACGHVNETSGR